MVDPPDVGWCTEFQRRASLEGRGRIGHQSERFIREVLGLQDATFGDTEHETSQPETACLYGFGSELTLGAI